MTPDAKRRIGAVAALVLGLSLGLALLPIHAPDTVPAAVGNFLWTAFGVGAIGWPLLGIGVAMAGFGWLERLDMKRTAILVGGLAVLIPFFIGAVRTIDAGAFDPELAQWGLWPRLVGILPGFLAHGLTSVLGKPITVLVGFLALTALTVLTVGWHPLARLEKRSGGPAVGRPEELKASPRFEQAMQTSVVEVEDLEDGSVDDAPMPRAKKPPKPKKP
ncbi:MAG TPA: hypothetical protein VF454_03565, partial [Gemmatimonadales bacterium]